MNVGPARVYIPQPKYGCVPLSQTKKFVFCARKIVFPIKFARSEMLPPSQRLYTGNETFVSTCALEKYIFQRLRV